MSQYVTTPDGTRHKFPNEATPEQIKAALSGYSAQGDTSGGRPILIPPQEGYPQPRAMTATNPFISRGLELLPSAGGYAGGFLGSVGGPAGMIGGAAAGGALGEGMRQAIGGGQFSPLAIGGRGLEQGALEATGLGLAKGAGALARPVMKRALGAGKAILSEFPDVVETALKRGLPVSEAGLAKAKALRQASADALSELLNDAKASGKTFKTKQITGEVRKLLRSEVLPDKEKLRIAQQLMDFVSDKGSQVGTKGRFPVYKQIDPVLLNEIKQFYQARARSVYRAGRMGGLTLAQENRGLFSKALASGARKQLETIPGVAARDAETQSLIGAQRAVADATMRPPRPFEIHKPGTYPIANSPQVMSKVALTLNSPMFKSLLRQSPRAAAALITELIHTDQPDQTGVAP